MDKFNLAEISQKLASTKQELLIQLSVQAQNYFAKSFKNQGFDGNQWEEVKRRKPEENAYKYPKGKGLQRRTQPILTGAGYKQRGGALRKAVATMSTTAIFRGNQVVMNVNLPYAKIHNEGGTINKSATTRSQNFKINKNGKSRFATKIRANFQQDVNVGAHTINIPKRQFIGQTSELTEMQKAKIIKVVGKIWEVKS